MNSKIDGGRDLEQGINTRRVFGRNEPSDALTLLYGKSPEEIASAITQLNPCKDRLCRLVDFGSFQGDLLREVITSLSWRGYRCESTAIDRLVSALDKNEEADIKFVSDLTKIPLGDDSQHVGMSRYTLHWNSLENQQKMLREFVRISQKGVVIQNVGPAPFEDYFDSDNRQEGLLNWRKAMNKIFSGEYVPQLSRKECYFSTRKELEYMMRNEGISYRVLDERVVGGVSDVLIERYSLNDETTLKVKSLLGNYDEVMKSTWIISKEPLKN